MIKWDGHTHSVFCRHGSGEDTAKMVERAIELGFDRYSITEHAPLPEGIIEDPELAAEFTLLTAELPDYFSHIKDLQKVYSDRIEILSGLELDYIVGYDSFFDSFIEENLPFLDDLIVSMHMMIGKNGVGPIDYLPELFDSEFIAFYGSAAGAHKAYWNSVRSMLEKPISPKLRKRIGHLGLINKYRKRYPPALTKEFYQQLYKDIFGLVNEKGWDLDFNVAGLSKELCGDAYIDDTMLNWCRHYKIKLIYGSDAHDVDSVGRHYDLYVEKTQ